MTQRQHDSDIIGDIYEASYRPEHWQKVLHRIADLTRSDSAALLYHDNELAAANSLHAWNLPTRLWEDYARIGPDPNFALFAESLPLGVASTAQQIIPDRTELERYYGETFTRLLVKHDIYYIGGVVLYNDAIRSVGVGLQRNQASGPWPQDAMEPLTQLSPHIQRALHIHKEFTRLRQREQALRAGLDKLLLGLVLFDDLLQPVYCNPIAESILNYHPAIRMQNDRLSAARPEDTDAIRTALYQAVSIGNEPGDRHTALGLHHPDCPIPLPMMITPIGEAGLGLQPGDIHAHAAVMFSDPEQNQPIVPEALKTAYGLTASEAQVAIAIANGLSVNEIAQLHNIKPATVKSQLLSIYRKLGISRQAELVKLLLTGPFRVNF